MSTEGRYVPPALRRREEEAARRQRGAKVQPLDRMERLAMISRSDGTEDESDSLKDHQVQEEFREYIENQLSAYKATHAFPPRMNDDGSSSLTPGQPETLTNILIQFRKLREGILASQRVDEFAIEAYEASARLAIYTQEHTALTSVLSRLVPDLYHEHEEATLAQSFSQLTTNGHTAPKRAWPTHGSNRDEYTAVHLLHLFLTGYPSQRDFLNRLYALLPHSSPNFNLVRTTAAHIRRNDFWALSSLVLHPPKERSDLVQRMLVLLLARVRERTWATLRAAYLQLLGGAWLCTALGLKGEKSLDAFMVERVKRGEALVKDGGPAVYALVKPGKAKG